MNIMIVNGLNHRATVYKPSELRKDALYSVRGKGKLVDYFVQVQDGGPSSATVSLVATYQDKAGFRGQVNTAI
jgi:hypothetical protein